MPKHWGWIASLAVAATLGGAGAVAAQGAPAVDPTWLQFNASAKTADFDLLAGMTTDFAGLNFNGFRAGGLTLTVPEGWTVTLHFKNKDPNLPHSAEVASGADVPSGPVKPAFSGAETGSLDTGMPPGASQDVKFVAAKAGSYMIICPVPGHAAAGMWIRFEVAAGATAPTLKATPQ
jgi:sulfocyanin